MKKLTFTIVFILSQIILLAQTEDSCLPEGITFTTQEEIDNFQTNYPGCTVIEGSIVVSGHLITNLNGLSVLTSIEGNLILGDPTGEVGPNIEDLSGLDNLTSIGGNFEMFGCGILATLAGIENLTFVGGNLNIGIVSDQIFPTLVPHGNSWLSNLSSLNGLTNIGGNLEIIGNGDLTNLVGLGSVTSVGGDVSIVYNQLTSLEGLNGLLHINNNLLIGACIYNGNVFSYINNYSLTSLSGLENLTSIGGSLWIVNNVSLSTCHVQSICDYLATPYGTVTINNNGPGCNSPEEVQEACLTSIKNYTDDIELTISPNPVSDFVVMAFNLHGSVPVNICIYNTTGICLKSWKLHANQTSQNEFQLNLEEIPAGMYFIIVTVENETITKKIIKL